MKGLTSSEILASGSAAMRRYHSLPRWRWLARRNAWNRFLFLSDLAKLYAELEAWRKENPILVECPICKAQEYPTCNMRYLA